MEKWSNLLNSEPLVFLEDTDIPSFAKPIDTESELQYNLVNLKNQKTMNNNWQFKLCKDYTEQEIAIIISQILKIFANGMGREGWSFGKIKEQLNVSTWLGLLKEQNSIIG